MDEPSADDASQVDMAESELRRLGLDVVRVRHHGELARLEFTDSQMESLAIGPLRDEIVRSVRSAGFRHVTVDLAAYADGPQGTPAE